MLHTASSERWERGRQQSPGCAVPGGPLPQHWSLQSCFRSAVWRVGRAEPGTATKTTIRHQRQEREERDPAGTQLPGRLRVGEKMRSSFPTVMSCSPSQPEKVFYVAPSPRSPAKWSRRWSRGIAIPARSRDELQPDMRTCSTTRTFLPAPVCSLLALHQSHGEVPEACLALQGLPQLSSVLGGVKQPANISDALLVVLMVMPGAGDALLKVSGQGDSSTAGLGLHSPLGQPCFSSRDGLREKKY